MIDIIAPVSGGWDSAVVWLFVTGVLRDGLHSFADRDAVAVFTDPGREYPRGRASAGTRLRRCWRE